MKREVVAIVKKYGTDIKSRISIIVECPDQCPPDVDALAERCMNEASSRLAYSTNPGSYATAKDHPLRLVSMNASETELGAIENYAGEPLEPVTA